jgi:sugar phosphate isomerase/epimerase
MPWTDAKDLTQAARIVERCGRANAGVLVDAFHLSRSGSRIADLSSVPRERLRFMQLCDAPAALPPTMDAILAEARGERLFPGDGEVDLVGLLRAMPGDTPLSLEVPTLTLARSMGAVDRARRALAATQRLLERLDA